jgi:hypothetical protein
MDDMGMISDVQVFDDGAGGPRIPAAVGLTDPTPQAARLVRQ